MADNEIDSASPLDKRELMEQVGRALADRRKLRKLSVSDVSQALKIRASFIEAIEAGTWYDLPGEVFARGFCMRYAQYVGLNGRDLMAAYLDKASTETKSSSDISPQFKKTETVKSPWVWAGVGLLFFAGMVKFLKPTPPPAAVPATKPAPAPKEEKPTPAEAPKLVLEKHKLEVFTPEQLWLRVTSSDRTFEGFIPEGATWSFAGEGDFDVRIGHTRNVALQFDGREVRLSENQRKIILPNAN